MSLESIYINNIKRKKDEINRLKTSKNKLLANSGNSSQKIIRLKKQLGIIKNNCTIKNRLSEINREEKKKSDYDKKIADYDKKIVQKEREIIFEEKKLYKEQEKIQREQDNKRKKEYNQIQNDINIQKHNTSLMLEEIKKMKKPKERINILFLAANPDILREDGTENAKLKLDKEAREIKEAITKSLKRDSINLETRWAVRTTDLLQAINETNPTIIHFSGHGTVDGKLVLQDNLDQPKLIEIDAVVQMIEASTDNLRLVVFNNCYSSFFANSIVNSVEASIGMNDTISDEVAIRFASQLYSAIGFGKTLNIAFNQAITAIKLEGFNEEKIPELYINENFSSEDICIIK